MTITVEQSVSDKPMSCLVYEMSENGETGQWLFFVFVHNWKIFSLLSKKKQTETYFF